MTKEQWEVVRLTLSSRQPSRATVFIFLGCLATTVSSLTLYQLGAISLVVTTPPLILAFLQCYLLVHEASHGAVHRRKTINNLIGHICGWIILLPFLQRQRSHLLHHIWAGHPIGDPANRRMIERFAVLDKRGETRLEVMWQWWLPLGALNDRLGLWRDPFMQARLSASRRYRREIRMTGVYFFFYLLIATILWANDFLTHLAVPYLLAWALLLATEELVNLPHHAGTPLLEKDSPPLPYWRQHEVTHSCKRIPVWSRYILLNFNLHTAHHLYPTLPWNHLPEAHRLLEKHLPELEKNLVGELEWSIKNRRRPILDVMGHYFDYRKRDRSKFARGN